MKPKRYKIKLPKSKTFMPRYKYENIIQINSSVPSTRTVSSRDQWYNQFKNWHLVIRMHSLLVRLFGRPVRSVLAQGRFGSFGHSITQVWQKQIGKLFSWHNQTGRRLYLSWSRIQENFSKKWLILWLFLVTKMSQTKIAYSKQCKFYMNDSSSDDSA